MSVEWRAKREYKSFPNIGFVVKRKNRVNLLMFSVLEAFLTEIDATCCNRYL